MYNVCISICLRLNGRGIALDGRRYFLASEAAADFGFSGDYIARLARHGKINGRRVGKKWYVEPESLRAYLKVLGEPEGSPSLSSEVPERTSVEQVAHAMHTRGRHTMRDWSPPNEASERPRSASPLFPLASLALAIILSTAAAYAAFNPTGPSTIVSRAQSQFAAASADTSIFDRAAQFLFRTVCPIFRNCDLNDVRIADSSNSGSANQNFGSAPLPRQAATTVSTPSTSSGQASSPQAASASSASTVAANPPVVQRVIERIVERALPTYAIAQGGITKAILNDRLNQLDNKLSSQIFSLSASLTSVPNSSPQVAVSPTTSLSRNTSTISTALRSHAPSSPTPPSPAATLPPRRSPVCSASEAAAPAHRPLPRTDKCSSATVRVATTFSPPHRSASALVRMLEAEAGNHLGKYLLQHAQMGPRRNA